MLSSVLRVLVASAVAGGVALVLWRALDDVFGRSLAGQLGSVIPALVASGGAYLVGCKLLQVEELRFLSALTHRGRG
jgi:hypothetical protein